MVTDWEGTLPDPYTQINLTEVEDAAPADGFGDRWEARVARTSWRPSRPA
jgi:hypothetical protein